MLSKKLKTRTYPPEKIPLAEALKFRYQNKLSLQEIADRYGVSSSAVHQRLAKFQALLLEPEEAEAFQDQETQILRTVRFKILEGMLSGDKIKDASLNNMAYAHSNLFRDESILSGRPTDISDNFTLTANIEDIRKRKAELLKDIQVVDIESGEAPPINEGKVGNEGASKETL
jgi:predicted DNA-binding protein YlxM (UPF0122 family)